MRKAETTKPACAGSGRNDLKVPESYQRCYAERKPQMRTIRAFPPWIARTVSSRADTASKPLRSSTS